MKLNRYSQMNIVMAMDIITAVAAIAFIGLRTLFRGPMNCNGVSFCIDLRGTFDLILASCVLLIIGTAGLILGMIARKDNPLEAKKAMYLSFLLMLMPILFWLLSGHY